MQNSHMVFKHRCVSAVCKLVKCKVVKIHPLFFYKQSPNERFQISPYSYVTAVRTVYYAAFTLTHRSNKCEFLP